MRKLLNLIIVALIPFFFSSCCASKTTICQKEAPFKVLNATYNIWDGGQPGVKGISINITIDNPTIQLDSVYFRNNKIPLRSDSKSEKLKFTGSYNLPYKNKDLIMSSNPLEEFGNKPHNIKPNIPFNLKKNEAVVSYFYKGKRNYYKIKNVTEIKTFPF